MWDARAVGNKRDVRLWWRVNVGGVDKYRGLEVDGEVVVNVVVVFFFFSFLAYMLPCDGFCLRFVLFNTYAIPYAINMQYTNFYQPTLLSTKLVRCN